MKILRRSLVALSVAAAALSHSAAQSGGAADLARRTFQNAEQLMREGKKDQAIKDYQQVISAFPDSPLVDDAILRIATFHYPPVAIGELGAVAAPAQEQARPLLEQIQQRYSESDSAPQATYKLGLLSMEPDSPKRDLETASAFFKRVQNIYPESSWVAHALLGEAVAEMGRRGYDRAIMSLEMALEESPHGPAAAECQFYLGVANVRAGDFTRAAEAFQSSRIESGKGGLAAKALDWLTLLYTMRLKPAGGGSIDPAHDGSFVPRIPAGEDLRGDVGLGMSAAGEILAADPRRGAVLAFGDDGAQIRSDPLEGARFAGSDAFGRTILVSPAQISIGPEIFPAGRKLGNTVRRIEDAGGVWRNSSREVFVLDLKEGEVLLYGADPADPKVLHRDKDAGTKFEAMAPGPEDRLYFLDTKGRAVHVYEGGKMRPLAAAGVGPALEDPTALAVSALGDIYVADARLKAVFILGQDGRRLAKISPPPGTLAELAAPRALAVSPRGEIYVHDERKKTILRFR